MKYIPAKLAATFAQRAGSKLRAHERRWKLRIPFEAGSVRVKIGASTRLTDLHTLFNAYALVVIIGELRQEFPLREVLAGYDFKGAGTRYVECANSKEIQIELKGIHRSQRLNGFSILPRREDGRGFEITLEIHGHKLCQDKKGSPPDSRKRKPTRKTQSKR